MENSGPKSFTHNHKNHQITKSFLKHKIYIKYSKILFCVVISSLPLWTWDTFSVKRTRTRISNTSLTSRIVEFFDIFRVFVILQLLKKISRLLYNVTVLFIPWEVRIKKIESELCFQCCACMHVSTILLLADIVQMFLSFLRSLRLRSGVLLHLSALVIWYQHCSVDHDGSLRYPPWGQNISIPEHIISALVNGVWLNQHSSSIHSKSGKLVSQHPNKKLFACLLYMCTFSDHSTSFGG